MSTNYTDNFALCQWEPTDPVQRVEFNQDNAKIDAALAGHAVLLAKSGNCQIHVQSYTGTGANGPLNFSFPQRPVFLMIIGENDTWVCGVRGISKIHGRRGTNAYFDTALTWAERSVTLGNAGISAVYCCNTEGVLYCVLALLDAGI